ncbi:MAG: carbohydrate kinase family protein [Planctomycetota bacterium]
MSESFDAVVAGHICLDITPEIRTGGQSAADLFRPGTLQAVGPATISTGGPVSNTGFPLRRLGLDAGLMGKCGDDVFGRAIIDCIRAEAPGAESGMRKVAGEQTSYTVVISPPGIDRMFLHCPGANDTFGADDIDADTVASARLMHFGYPPLMARTWADDGAELVKIFADAHDAGVTTSLDMAYPDPATPAGKADWSAILSKALPHVDVFTPSAEELTFMLRRETFDKLSRQAEGRELLGLIDGKLLSGFGEQCVSAGAAVVLIKCGVHGLYLRTGGTERFGGTGRGGPEDVDAWANRELFAPSYSVDQIVSANGAGDCAIAGFLTAILHDCDAADALRFGCAVGAQNLSAVDTISGVRTWEKTVEQVKSQPPQNEVSIDLSGWRLDKDSRLYVGPADSNAGGF